MSRVSTKADTKDARLSVTPKPSVAAELSEMASQSELSKNELFNVAIDILYFVWTILRQGGAIGVRMPGDQEFKEFQFYIPGMTKPFSSQS